MSRKAIDDYFKDVLTEGDLPEFSRPKKLDMTEFEKDNERIAKTLEFNDKDEAELNDDFGLGGDEFPDVFAGQSFHRDKGREM